MGVTSRLLIVANRLPLTVTAGDDGPKIEPSTGGLATGLRGPHEKGDGLWFGWPGALTGFRDKKKRAVLQQLREQRFVPIELQRDEVTSYYNDFSNGVIWPTFHYMTERVPMQTPDWDVYRRVNERFADAVAKEWRPGDVIWVHDFHLMLVPELLRQRVPEARIGYFLHIPFPSSEIFRVLPWRTELLRGLLGADLIGFHTLGYLRHFAASLLRILGVEVEVDRVTWENREVRLAALPMGIDVAAFTALGADPAVQKEAAALRAQSAGRKIVLGIDRLDYTKGIPWRLTAFERLLEKRSPDEPPVQLVQVAVTSRGDVTAYQSFKRGVDELVGRINGRFGTPTYTPIRYTNRSLDSREVSALYLAADAMWVTPLRDGLNLVAKEFVAAREDGDGVLVLSEFAGVAAEFPEALQFNPYDVEGSATTLATALAMPEEDRRRRMASMRGVTARHDVHKWVATFLDELNAPRANAVTVQRGFAAASAAVAALRERTPLLVFVDYDGTLTDLAQRPEFATPDRALLDLLRRLAAKPGVELHLVSGRPATFLEQWFGELPIGLHGEHGQVSRLPNTTAWTDPPAETPEWRARVIALLDRIASHIPGSFVESKRMSIAWHYRQVEPEFAQTVAKELRLHLLELLSNVGVAVVEGNRVIEVRPQGVHKGQIVARALGHHGQGAALLVIGDDRTDEDMFAAAPTDAVTVHVGQGRSLARFEIADPRAARQLLRSLFE